MFSKASPRLLWAIAYVGLIFRARVEVLQRALVVAARHEDVAAIVIRLEISRIDLDGAIVVGESQVEFAGLAIADGAIVVVPSRCAGSC